MADRWGEPDPRKLGDLPANILTHWEAYFDLLSEAASEPPKPQTPAAPEPVQGDQEFADCLRILGNGC
ncbi:MAG TPA: hypothetical protein DEQ39_04700 [Atlantibacter hermannii]|nr:hypothetical protein [Atlantibacter hermannii]